MDRPEDVLPSFVPAANRLQNNLGAATRWSLTTTAGLQKKAAPYINNCGFDLAANPPQPYGR